MDSGLISLDRRLARLEHEPTQACQPGGEGEGEGEAEGESEEEQFLAQADLAEVWAKLRAGTLRPEAVAKTYAGNVEWNEVRNAIQVIACDGKVAAHIPLGGVEVRAAN